MPATPKFRIKKRVDGASVFYSIDVPPYLSPKKKRERRYFSTRAEAELARGELLAQLRTDEPQNALSATQARDAIRALELLADNKLAHLSLRQAIELALPRLLASGISMTVAELCAEFSAAKAEEWSVKSRSNFAFATKSFLEAFGQRELSAIAPRDLAAWLTRYESPAYRANIIRTLRPAFSYAVRREYLPENPFSKLETVRVQKTDAIDVFTPDEARRLVCTAPADCRPAYALLLFAGVRPTELTRLTWGNIHDGFIHILPSVAKTGQVRNIDIEPNLAEWLHTSGVHEPSERICPNNWKRKNQAHRAACGLASRPDTARHSYASYWLALHKDADALKLRMGHSRSSDTLFAHYRAAATPAAAAEYWNIRPE